MDKRFFAFLLASVLIMTAFIAVDRMLRPEQPPELAQDEQVEPGERPAGEQPAAERDRQGEGKKKKASDEGEAAAQQDGAPDASEPSAEADAADPAEQAPQRQAAAQRWVAVGSVDPESQYPMLVTFNSRGAAIERIELSSLRYRDLDDDRGYLGSLAATDVAGGRGVRVNVVGAGTPAAAAASETPGVAPGLKPGDVIRALDGQPVSDAVAFLALLAQTDPKQRVTLDVERQVDGKMSKLQFVTVLARKPLELIQPERRETVEAAAPDLVPALAAIQRDRLSCLLSLESVGDESVARGALEIAGLPSLRDANWETEELTGDRPGVEFRYRLTPQDLEAIGQQGALEVVKRFRLIPAEHVPGEGHTFSTYTLDMEIELRNVGEQPLDVAYRLDGPNGLPLEGWWYSNKIHPTNFFSGAGARDVVWNTLHHGHRLIGASDIYKVAAAAAEDPKKPPAVPLFVGTDVEDRRTVRYIGVDTQYFACVYQPPEGDAESFVFEQALPLMVGDPDQLEGSEIRTTNVSFQLVSPVITIEPEQAYTQRLQIFAGPKEPDLLEANGLSELVEYGWFPLVARPLSWVLHFFYGIVHNYGIAIILLTVVVRGAMFPISRKAARNAQMMQQLAPEMKKITEKYKNDMEKRAKAQQDLFRKHNYNPFGGCLLMFLQLPIFIGLYRSLSVDINLRQAPLIPGIDWCSNLAGPDKLWYWEPYLPEMLAGTTGWLGPYLNVLPLFTVALFLVHQKLFTPPATDEQTRMQQKMMKFMTVFIGVMFFKVASGLCLYFIASSLWGIAERQLLPKTPTPGEPAAGASTPAARTASKPAPAKPGPNGASSTGSKSGKRRQKRR